MRFAFFDNNKVYGFQGGFDPAYTKNGLGAIQRALCLRACVHDERIREYDFSERRRTLQKHVDQAAPRKRLLDADASRNALLDLHGVPETHTNRKIGWEANTSGIYKSGSISPVHRKASLLEVSTTRRSAAFYNQSCQKHVAVSLTANRRASARCAAHRAFVVPLLLTRISPAQQLAAQVLHVISLKLFTTSPTA